MPLAGGLLAEHASQSTVLFGEGKCEHNSFLGQGRSIMRIPNCSAQLVNSEFNLRAGNIESIINH